MANLIFWLKQWGNKQPLWSDLYTNTQTCLQEAQSLRMYKSWEDIVKKDYIFKH